MVVSSLWTFKKSIYDLDICGKRVLCRVDFNVPIKDGEIIDDTRIQHTLPTIQYLINKGAKVVLLSHLGRPKGQIVEAMRLTPIAKHLSVLLGVPVEKVDEAWGSRVEEKVCMMKKGQVLLLENIRFYPGEEQNDPELAKALAKLADIFVNDAFGVAHRNHASTVGIAAYLPSVLGLLMEREIRVLGKALTNPKRPFTAVIGGSKIKDKIGVIEHLLNKVDHLMIGGGLAYTFLKAKGYEVGQSLLEHSRIEWADRCLKKAKDQGVKVYLPVDIVVANPFNQDGEVQIVDVRHVPVSGQGLDIGPKTRALYANIIENSRLVIWNGPMGMFEMQPFVNGTKSLAYALAKATSTFSIVGGGDTLSAIKAFGLIDYIDHVSTGGGALLKFMEGKVLPVLGDVEHIV